MRLPTRRAAGHDRLSIVRDTRERYGWTFERQQADVVRDALPVGDYAVRGVDGDAVAVVERKTLDDLAGRIADGTLAFVMADLAAVDRAAVVVEGRYGDLFDVAHVQAGFLAEQLAHLQVRYPSVTVMFAGSRPFAQEWTFRWLGAAARELDTHQNPAEPDTLGRGDIVTLYEGRKWKNRAHGNRRATSVHDTHDEAIEVGAQLARERGLVHHNTPLCPDEASRTVGADGSGAIRHQPRANPGRVVAHCA